MSKIKVGKIYNKSIVAGDKNLVTSNEIHKSNLNGCVENNDNNNTQVPQLTKGQKILSEYYYIDYNKLIANLEKDQDIKRLVQSFLGEMFGSDLDNKQTQSTIEVISGEIYMNTEINHSIFKMAFGGMVIYLEDNFFVGSGTFDCLQIAVRKYSKLDQLAGSSGFTPTINSYVPISTLYDNLYSGKRFEEIIAPCLITEEEFWAEAKINN